MINGNIGRPFADHTPLRAQLPGVTRGSKICTIIHPTVHLLSDASSAGNPITLCILYMAVARRVGLHLDPVALPRHVIVYSPLDQTYVDVFNRGTTLDTEQALGLATALAGEKVSPGVLLPADTRAVMQRMLRNLSGIYAEKSNMELLKHTNAQQQMILDWGWDLEADLQRGMRAADGGGRAEEGN